MELQWFIVDTDDAPVVNGSDDTTLVIREGSTGYLLDWITADTFEPSGGIEPSANYDEVNSTFVPGLYVKEIDISDWVDGDYQIISYFDNGVLTLSKFEEITVRDGAKYENQVVDNSILAEISSNTASINSNTMTTPAATILLQEYYNNEDADGNTLIYGVDFYITTDRPKILDSVPKRGVPMTWTEYLNSI